MSAHSASRGVESATDASPYEERTYRRIHSAPGLDAYTLVVKETDVHIMTRGVWREEARDVLLRLRRQVELAIAEDSEFLHSLKPVAVKDTAPLVVRMMADAAQRANVGPMAAVAGAIAQLLGEALLTYSDEVVIENGGDDYIRCRHPLSVGIYAGKSLLSGRIGIQINPEKMPMGVCTSSGTVGPSLSLGRADAVTILSRSAALADAAATAVGNVISRAEDIPRGLERAREIAGVEGALIIVGAAVGAWGEVEIIETRGLP